MDGSARASMRPGSGVIRSGIRTMPRAAALSSLRSWSVRIREAPAVARRRELMRILLAHNSLYYPSFGGGDKSNRLLMEALAARGHDVRVVARVAKFGRRNRPFLAELETRGVHPEIGQDAVQFVLGGVDVRTLTRNPHLRGVFFRAVRGVRSRCDSDFHRRSGAASV